MALFYCHSAGWQRGSRLRVCAEAAPIKYKLKICVHKTCKNQGSRQIEQFVRDLNLDRVEVVEMGCMDNCGQGPNMMLVPSEGMGERLSHITTPTRMAAVLRDHCHAEVDLRILKASEAQMAGKFAYRRGDLQKAIALFTEGLEACPSVGMHLLLANRAAVRLETGDAEGALEDALAAADCAPPDYTAAYVRQVEALLRLGRAQDAMLALVAAVERCPEFAGSMEHSELMVHVQREQHAHHHPAKA